MTGGGICTGVRGGAVPQPASVNAATTAAEASKLRGIVNKGDMMGAWLLMAEGGVAMFLLVFIVWWTMYSGPKVPPPKKQEAPPQERDGADGK